MTDTENLNNAADGGLASHDLLAALDVISTAKLDLRNSVKQAVEKAVERWHDRWPGKVLPIITVNTTPETVDGGRTRRVAARVSVEFFR